MTDSKILTIIKSFHDQLPHFPDGRIDYSHSSQAPVIMCFIQFDDEILLLKRSNKVANYQGKWNGVGGFLDEVKPIEEKVIEEITEELAINPANIARIKLGRLHKLTDPSISKTWLIQPVLVTTKSKPNIKLDWEHTDYKWVKPQEIKNYDIVPGLDKSLNLALK